jgi:hypothetical protein
MVTVKAIGSAACAGAQTHAATAPAAANARASLTPLVQWFTLFASLSFECTRAASVNLEMEIRFYPLALHRA